MYIDIFCFVEEVLFWIMDNKFMEYIIIGYVLLGYITDFINIWIVL